MLFMGLLEVFLRSQCDLEDPCGRPKVRNRLKTNPIFFKLHLSEIIFFKSVSFSFRVVQFLKMTTILLWLEAVRVDQ